MARRLLGPVEAALGCSQVPMEGDELLQRQEVSPMAKGEGQGAVWWTRVRGWWFLRPHQPRAGTGPAPSSRVVAERTVGPGAGKHPYPMPPQVPPPCLLLLTRSWMIQLRTISIWVSDPAHPQSSLLGWVQRLPRDTLDLQMGLVK